LTSDNAGSRPDAAVRPAGSTRPLAEAYDTALLDLDGVVYVGPAAVPHAAETLARARELGMRLAYVTNNAARTPATVAGHLSDLGVPADPEDVVTSAQAAARLVAERVEPGSAVLVVGGAGLREALVERGLRPVETAEEAAAVVQGFAPEVSWSQLAEGTYAVARGVPWVASNLDLTIPTARGIAPGNGTLVAAVRTATGVDPAVAGKPELPLHRETIIRTGARAPLVVGDRLDTDIEGANNAGVDSLLVFTGVATPVEVLTAPAPLRPTYLAADLRGLLAAQPAPVPGERGWSCGAWSATVRDGEAQLRRDFGPEGRSASGADPYDGLRALCAAVWAEERTPSIGKAVSEWEAAAFSRPGAR
jgi:glycerol-1-phosphatase